jgi:NNP family nitrate/nitrite transporter-like MFS transporter
LFFAVFETLLAQSKQHTGSYRTGFIVYAALACVILAMLRYVSREWTRTWIGAGGRALADTLPVADVAGD